MFLNVRIYIIILLMITLQILGVVLSIITTKWLQLLYNGTLLWPVSYSVEKLYEVLLKYVIPIILLTKLAIIAGKINVTSQIYVLLYFFV